MLRHARRLRTDLVEGLWKTWLPCVVPKSLFSNPGRRKRQKSPSLPHHGCLSKFAANITGVADTNGTQLQCHGAFLQTRCYHTLVLSADEREQAKCLRIRER